MIHPAEIAGVMDKWNAAVATGQVYENVERVRRADGEYPWFLRRAAPLRDESGKIVKWYGADIDIEDWTDLAPLRISKNPPRLEFGLRAYT